MTAPPSLPSADSPGFLRRIGGVLVRPRALLAHLSPETGKHDATLLFGAWILAIALPELGAALADLRALGGLEGVLALAQCVWPVLPWLITSALVERLLGPDRAHRAALCLVPLLVIGAGAHLLTALDLLALRSWYAPALGGLTAVVFAHRLRPAIPPLPPLPTDLSSETATDPLSPDPTTDNLAPNPTTHDLSPDPAPTHLSPGTAPLPPLPADLSPETATADLSPGTAPAHLAPDAAQAPSRALALLAGLLVLALTAAAAGRDLAELARSWSTLAPTSVGDPLPAFSVPLLDGGTLRSEDLASRPHLLIFWTTWCGVCEAEMPMYSALAQRHPDLRVIAVNADRDGDLPAQVRAYRDAHALRVPVALDRGGAMTRAFRVRMYPHLVLTDAHGQIRRVFRGRTLARTLDLAIAELTL